MPTTQDPHNNQPEPELVQEMEIEETSMEVTLDASPAESETGEVPFADVDHDPGMDLPPSEGEEGEEAAAPEPIVYRDLSPVELQAAVEATFFMHHKPISVAKVRELINPGIAEDDYRTAISNLMATYFDEAKGIELIEAAGGFQFRTKAEHKDIVRRMYQIAPMKLTNAMLEVLAIVAYNQPITREVVDKIRGVDSSHLMRVLLDKKMLRIAGKSDDIGRPMIYATSKEFLELFGLRDLSALPSLRELEEMLPQNEVGSISEEEALSAEMEGIVTDAKPLEFNDLELEDWEENESPKDKTEIEPTVAHGNGGQTVDLSAQNGNEAGDNELLPPEIARRITPGQEGNA